MKICTQCGKTTESEGNFCESCGGTLVEAAFCPHCGTAMPVDAKECPACGKAPNEDCPNGETQNEVSAPMSESKPKNKLPLIIGIGAAVLAVAAIGTVALISRSKGNKSGGKADEMLLFERNGKLELLTDKKGGSVRLVKNGSTDIDGYIINGGKTLLYVNDYTAYYLQLKDKDAKPKKIDKIYDTLQLSNDGTIAYTDDDGELFFGSYEKSESVDKDVADYLYDAESGSLVYRTDNDDLFLMPKNREAERVTKNSTYSYSLSKDGSSILYLNQSGDVYLKKYGKEKEKLASDVSELGFANENLSLFYYTDEDNVLYSQKGKKSPVEISDDVYDIIDISRKSDCVMFLTGDDFSSRHDLCLYNGKEVETIAEDVYGAYTSFRYDDTLVYRYYTDDEYDNCCYVLIKNGQFRTFEDLIGDEADEYDYELGDDALYIIADDTVYSVSLSAALPERATEVTELPAPYDRYTLSEFKGKPYFKTADYERDEYALYWGDEEVYDGYTFYVTSDKNYLYYTTEDLELYRFDGKKSELMAEDVGDAQFVNDDLYYIGNYDEDEECGDLFLWRANKKTEPLAEEVGYLSSVWAIANDKSTYYLFGSY